MTIFKITGSVEEQKSTNHARIKVHSFKRNGITVNSAAEIKDLFSPRGYVFAPRFFEELDYPLNSLVEFSASQISFKREENHDDYIMQNLKDCRQAGFPLIKLSNIPFISDLSIDLSKLKTIITIDATHFYISAHNFIYGPLKNSNSDILPKTGTEIFRFAEEPNNQITTGENTFLLSQPQGSVDKIDCMTIAQLGEWIKQHLKGTSINYDFTLLKKLLESHQMQELNKARLERAMISLDNLSLTNDYLKTLAGSSDKYLAIYEKAILNIEETLKENLVEPYQKKKKVLEQELSMLQQKITAVRQQGIEANTKFKDLTASYDHIVENRERLIEDIRVQSLFNSNAAIEKLITYHDYYEKRDQPDYATIDDFVAVYQKSIETDSVNVTKYARNIVYQFKDFRCFLSNAIEPILHLSKLCGNVRVFIQQVEPDWLKFEKLYENGLKQIWNSAHNDPNTLHFFILEDINLASIECYGKPVLDMISNIRSIIPGLKTGWPDNLWIFGVPVSKCEDVAFGLPLIPQTFNKWGAFPKTDLLPAFTLPEHLNVMSLHTLINHDKIISNPITEYFATT